MRRGGDTASRGGRTDGSRRLTGVDQMYLALESPATPMHFGALVVLDGEALCAPDGGLRLALIRRHIDARTRAVPELRRIIHRPGPLAGAPLWIEDPGFRIERHVSEVPMPGPTNLADDEALLRFVEPLMAPLLDRARPLWRLSFVTGLPDGRIAALFVVHHALADGLTAMRLARSLLEAPLRDAGDRTPPVQTASTATSPPPWRTLVRDNLNRTLAAMRRLARPTTRRTARRLMRSFLTGWSATRHEPRTSLNAQVGPRRRSAVIRLEQRTARRVARAHGAGVNDLVLDLVAGGSRALLASRGEPVDRLAPRVGIAVALPPGERREAGNHFGSYVIPMPLFEGDPSARLRRIADAWIRAKQTQVVTSTTGVRAWTARFAPTRHLIGRQRVIQVMETYLPGPPHQMQVLGAPVLDLVPIPPLGRNVGLTFVGSSYAGCITLTVRADADGFPDLDVLLAGMERDWRTLAG